MFQQFFILIVLYHVTMIDSKFTVEQKCRIADSTCWLETAQQVLPHFTAGIPELGIKPMDVMVLDKMMIEASGIELKMENIRVKGLRNAVIKEIKCDMNNKTLQVSLFTDLLIKGKYVSSGKVIMLPIFGDGNFTVELKKVKLNVTLHFAIEKNQDGVDFLEPKSLEYNYDIRGYLRMNLTNLYNGNKFLSDILHQFVNENWKELSDVFGEPLLNEPINLVFEVIKTYFRSQSIEQLFLN